MTIVKNFDNYKEAFEKISNGTEGENVSLKDGEQIRLFINGDGVVEKISIVNKNTLKVIRGVEFGNVSIVTKLNSLTNLVLGK